MALSTALHQSVGGFYGQTRNLMMYDSYRFDLKQFTVMTYALDIIIVENYVGARYQEFQSLTLGHYTTLDATSEVIPIDVSFI